MTKLKAFTTGAKMCFFSPIFFHLPALYLATSLVIAYDTTLLQTAIAILGAGLCVTSLALWTRSMIEHGTQAEPGDAPCDASRSAPRARLSWTSIRNGIHLATRTGHADMHPSRAFANAALLALMGIWILTGNDTPAIEVPVAVLALTHLLLYVRETNAVGAHADMDTVDYCPQGSVLGYDRKP